MEGVHDMGGLHGFGAVPVDDVELPFDEPWEGRTFGLFIAAGVAGARSGSIRPGIEAISAAEYLAMSYFERWARSLEGGLVDAGTLTVADIDERVRDPHPPGEHADDVNPRLAAGLAAALVDHPRGPSGEDVPALFDVGHAVTVKRMAPVDHHRCPRYVRGVSGTVASRPGGWPHASGHGPPENVYTVRFAMRDLWGDDAEPGFLYLDLWERYLA